MDTKQTVSDLVTPAEVGYREINRRAWADLAGQGCDASLPYGPAQFARAREWLDGSGWVPWPEIESVLCLACGGGQQAPLFATLGCQVTVVDISPEQLARDRQVSEQYGLNIECIEGDMLDLSSLYGRNFDFVFQPISACYVPDVNRLYREVRRVLKPKGCYQVTHWNPIHLQLKEDHNWDGHGYQLVRPQQSDEPLLWTGRSLDGTTGPICWHYLHRLNDLIGGLGTAGFIILHFAEAWLGDPSAEPGSQAHLAAYLPPFMTLFSQMTEI